MGAAKIIPADRERLYLPYQERWVDDTSRLKLCEKGRQIGISLASAGAAVERTAAREARLDQWASSRDETQAKLLIEDATRIAEVFHVAAQYEGRQVIDQATQQSAYVLRFANGRRIWSLTSNVDAQAGKRGGRILDEFALHLDPRKLYGVAYPGITWGGQLEIVSTHRGTDNFFNELVEEARHGGNPKGFSLHSVTLEDALAQGFLYKLQSVLPLEDERQEMDEAAYFDFIRAGCASEEQFLQEYQCKPADDEAAFLSYDLIASCEYAPGEKWAMTGPGEGPDGRKMRELYLGIDVGRTRDLTVFWIVERYLGLLLTRLLVSMQRASFAEQEAQLDELMGIRSIRRACIDSTGLGMQMAERAQERHGERRVEAVRFSNTVKEALAYPVRSAFEGKQLRIPRDDAVRADLRGVRKSTTAAGNLRFDAAATEAGHSDRFWALALALHAADHSKPQALEYQSAARRRFNGASRRRAW